MKNYLKYLVGGIIVIIIIIGYMFWQSMTGPIYNPGDILKGKNIRSPLIPPKQKTTESFWQVEEDIQLNYFTKGEGRNVLIIHGGPGIPYVEAWPGLDALTNEYKFYYYDQRGAGRSTRPITSFNSTNYYKNMLEAESTLGLTAQIADIERIRQILGEDKLIIIGHSFGSVLASLYASEFPNNVESLVLVAPAPLLKMPSNFTGLFDSIEKNLPSENLSDYQAFLGAYFDFKSIFSKTDDELVAQSIELSKYFELALEDYDVIFPEFGKPGGWMVQAMYLSMGKEHDYTKAVKKVKVPTLIIHANNDLVQVEAASRTYLDVFPHAEFQVIEDAGHMVFYDKPDEFGKITENFFKNY